MTRENLTQVVAQYEELVKMAQQNGEISAERDAKAIARFIFSAHNGLRVIAKITDERKVLEDIKAETLRVLS
ncbi:MAG: hypothetical protein AAF206_22380 [Bacteroidota bacterium]